MPASYITQPHKGDVSKVKVGDSIRASTINRIIEGLGLRSSEFAGYGALGELPQIVCRAKNIGTSNLNLHDVAIIKGQVFGVDPEDQREILLQVGIAESTDDLDHLVVCQEQILAQTLDEEDEELTPAGVGEVCLLGLSWINSDSGSGTLGAAESGLTTLAVGNVGPVQVLYGSGAAKVLGRLGGGGGTASANLPHAHQSHDWGYLAMWTD